MNDQMVNLPTEISGCIISSSVSSKNIILILDKISKGLIKLIYISPEFFLKPSFQSLLYNTNIFPKPSLIVLDEVHCISQWSHSFRPSFFRLVQTFSKDYYKNIPFLLLTATANQNVNKSLKDWFNIDDTSTFILNWQRDNLEYYIISDPDKYKL